MKNITICYKEPNDLLNVKDEVLSYPKENVLIQVFSGIVNIEVISQLQSYIRENFPGIAVLGATTAGEIFNAHAVERSIIINITLFRQTRIQSVMIGQNNDLSAAGKEMGDFFKERKPKVVIAFGCGIRDGIFYDNIPFLESLSMQLDGAIIAGGLAGDNSEAIRTFIFNENTVAENGFVAAALSGSTLRIHNAYYLGWLPIGRKMTITKSDGNRVYEIDHKSITAIYKQYLGIEYEQIGPHHPSLEFPLLMERDGLLRTNPPLKWNSDGSFDFTQRFYTGEQVRFSYCDIQTQEEGALKLKRTLATYQPETVFVYSCASRKLILGSDISLDMASLQDFPDATGFFTYGEFYSDVRNKPHYLQQTMTVLALSETDPREENLSSNNISIWQSESDMRQFRILKVLSQLVNTTTQELEFKNQELASLVNNDALTGLANRRYFNEFILREIKNHSRSGNFLSIILLDVDFFKQFNDLYGHVAGDNCLRGIAQVLLTIIQRPSDIAFRYGGEEFGCILTSTDQKGALAVAEKIRTDIEKLAIPHIGSKICDFITVSLGVFTTHCTPESSPDAILNSCDEQLYSAKKSGRNRIEGKYAANNS